MTKAEYEKKLNVAFAKLDETYAKLRSYVQRIDELHKALEPYENLNHKFEINIVTLLLIADDGYAYAKINDEIKSVSCNSLDVRRGQINASYSDKCECCGNIVYKEVKLFFEEFRKTWSDKREDLE